MSHHTTGIRASAASLGSRALVAVFLAGLLLAFTMGGAQPAAADPQPGSCRGGGSPRTWGTKCGTPFVCAYQDATYGPLPTTTYYFHVTDQTTGGTVVVSVTLMSGTQNAACVSPGAYRIGTTLQVVETVPPSQQVTSIKGFAASLQTDPQAGKATVTLSAGVSEVHFYNANELNQ